MSSDEKENNKMEVFSSRNVHVERRPVLSGGLRPSQMEKPPDLVAWWRIVRKHHWTVLTAFVVLFLTVLIGSWKEKPVYRAKALIEIDKEDPNVPNPQELFQMNEVSDAYLETQYKVLGSDDLAERVIHQLDLNQNSEFLPSRFHWPWITPPVLAAEPVKQNKNEDDPFAQDMVLKRFQDRLDIRPVRRSRVV